MASFLVIVIISIITQVYLSLPPDDNATSIINRWTTHYNGYHHYGPDQTSPKHSSKLPSTSIVSSSSSSSSLFPSSSYQNRFVNVTDFTMNVSKTYEFICATQFGYYRDPGNCSSYYICSFGIPLHQNCSKGLYFSERLQICDWPTNVPCEKDYASLHAETSMFNLIDEPNSTSATTSSNYTASLSTNHMLTTSVSPFRNISGYSSNLLNLESSAFNISYPYPTIRPLISSETSRAVIVSKHTFPSLIKTSKNYTVIPQSSLNTLEKYESNPRKKYQYPTTAYVVDGFEVPSTTKKIKSSNLNQYKFDDDLSISHLSNYNNNSHNSKFMEISKLNGYNNNNAREQQNNNNQVFQKRQGFEPFWLETGYLSIDEKHINPFTLYDRTKADNYYNERNKLTFGADNPYMNNEKYKKTDPLYWFENTSLSLDSFGHNQDPNNQNQNIFRYSNPNGYDASIFNNNNNNNNNKDVSTFPINKHSTTIKPTGPLRRKIPELYIKIVASDNFSSPYMAINDNGQTKQEMIVLKKPMDKRLNYEINERLLAPFKQQKNEHSTFSLKLLDKNAKQNVRQTIRFNGINRYSYQKHTTSLPEIIKDVTHGTHGRFKKKVIKKKMMNYLQPLSLLSSSPSSSSAAMAASSSSTNVYGHPTNHLVTSSFNNNNNNEHKIKQNSRPPLFKSTIALNYVHQNDKKLTSTPTTTLSREWTPVNRSLNLATTPAPIVERKIVQHTTLKPKMPTQRNRPQAPEMNTNLPIINISKNDDIIKHMKKTNSVVVVPMYTNPKPKQLNLAQYNSYIVIPPGKSDKDKNKINENSHDVKMPKSKEAVTKIFESKYTNTKEPLDTLEEFIKKTINDSARMDLVRHSVSTTTIPISMQHFTPTPLTYTTMPQGNEMNKEQVFKKIKAINGFRRSRKYRPLISLHQSVSVKRNASNQYDSLEHISNEDLTNRSNKNKAINLSDPKTITVYETLKSNEVDQDRTKPIDNFWNNQPLTTTPIPSSTTQRSLLPKSIYGDRESSIHITVKPDNLMESIDVPTDINTIPVTSTTKAPRITFSKPKNKNKVAIRIRLPSSTTTTTTTTTSVPKNSTEYNYYDYDNYDNSNDYDLNNYDDEYYNLLHESKEFRTSTTSTTTTTTTTTVAPMVIPSYKRKNVTRKPLIYLRNRPRPTIRRLIIKDPSENNKIISASRPRPQYSQPKALVTASKCDKRKCRLPDCRCGSSDIPGDLSNKHIPQIVMLTFDDAVNDLNWDLYEEILNSNRRNPNGCPIKATFYVSHEWTDYGQVQTLYSRGHEIASHTISHRFGEKFSKDEWIKEINGQREILHLYGGVKFEDIRGMRAPFLQTGGNNMFEMLFETNFTYDSSLPVQENNPPYWPYTLDYALSHSCNIPPCPTKSFPGVWEVGMVMWSDLRGGRCSMGDACTNPSDEDGVYEMLIKNFNRHYKSNRAPFSLYYHSAWFNTQHHKRGFIRFLDEIIQNNDVYFTTTWQMLQWIREPTPLDKLHLFGPFQCKNEKPVSECIRPKACNVNSKQGSRTLRTCQECPTVFPWIGDTGFPKSKYG